MLYHLTYQVIYPKYDTLLPDDHCLDQGRTGFRYRDYLSTRYGTENITDNRERPPGAQDSQKIWRDIFRGNPASHSLQ
jgi:hypothetical protein